MLLLVLIPIQAQSDSGGKAKIVTQNERPGDCISKVAIREIDGKLTSVPKAGFSLDAGRHSMNGSYIINRGICPIVSSKRAPAIPDLEAVFEAGKTYYVGLDHSSTNKNEWRLVIWKTE